MSVSTPTRARAQRLGALEGYDATLQSLPMAVLSLATVPAFLCLCAPLMLASAAAAGWQVALKHQSDDFKDAAEGGREKPAIWFVNNRQV